MKNDLVETVDLGWLRFFSLGLVYAPYAVSAASNNLSISQTVDHWSWAFADFPSFAGLCRGSKENWNLIPVWKNLSKRRREANCSRLLGMLLISVLGTVLLRWLHGEVTTANQASLMEEFRRGNTMLLAIMLGVLAPIAEEIIFRGIIPLKIFQGYESWGYIIGGLLFAIFHGPTNIMSFVIYGGASVILTLLAYRTRRLEVSIAVHMINNGLPAILMLLIPIFGVEV